MIRKRWFEISLVVLALAAFVGLGAYCCPPFASATTAALTAPATNAPAPEFSAMGADGKTHALSDYRGKIVFLEWTSPVCEVTAGKYKSGAIQEFQKKVVDGGGVWLQISSAAKGTPGFMTPDKVAGLVQSRSIHLTQFLLDDSGTVGKLYGARSTPTLALIDASSMLRYYGAYDDLPWGDMATAKHRYAEAALEAVNSGKPADPSRTAPYGCFIQY